MVALIVNKKSNNNQLTFNILNFNLDYFDTENLKIETVDITRSAKSASGKIFPQQIRCSVIRGADPV